jgi:hypothetical protein
MGFRANDSRLFFDQIEARPVCGQREIPRAVIIGLLEIPVFQWKKSCGGRTRNHVAATADLRSGRAGTVSNPDHGSASL